MWRNCNPCALLGMPNGAAAVENSMMVPQTITNTTTNRSSSSTSGYTTKRIHNRVLKRYLYTRVYSSIVHNSQEVEATQVSING